MTSSRTILAVPLVALLATTHGFGSSKVQIIVDVANDLYIAQEYENAIAQCDRVLELDSTNWSANYLTAVSYLALYRPSSDKPGDEEYAEKALAAFERTLALEPPTPEERRTAENFYLTLLDAVGDKDKAIAYLEKQLVSRPDDLLLISQVAILYQRKGEFSKALEFFEKRADLDTTNKESWYTLGVNCWAWSYHGGSALSQEEREQIVDKGIRALERALAIDPDYFEALAYANLSYREKAKTLAVAGKDDEARQAFDKANEYQRRAIDIRNRQKAIAKAS